MGSHKNFKSLADEIKKEVLNEMQSESFMAEIGELIVDVIYKRVKSGKGVKSDSDQLPETTQLKSLSPKYKKARENKTLGEFGSPNKSNLTNTGQMLSSMTFKAEVGKVTVEIPSTTRTEGLTNAEVALFVREERPFFNLSRGEVLIVSKLVKDKITEVIRLFNK